MLRRLLALLAVVVGAIVVTPAIASAHPLGNFTVNTYAGLRVEPTRVSVDYVVDMAEIPTLQNAPRRGPQRRRHRAARRIEPRTGRPSAPG